MLAPSCMDTITWTPQKRKLSDLIPWERNPRQLTKDQAEQLKRSIEKFGLAIPFNVGPANELYDGHQRQNVLGLMSGAYKPDHEIDVMVSSRALTEAERAEFTVRINANRGEWDFDQIANEYEFEDLKDWGFDDLDKVDFPVEDLDDPGADLDKAEELREKWGVESGQLWQLGDHRVICGDCTDAAVVGRLMGGERADFTFADPPYGQEYQSNMRVKSKKFDMLTGDNEIDAGFLDMVDEFSNGWCLVCSSWKVMFDWKVFLDRFGNMSNLLVWDKGGGGMGDLSRSLLTDYEVVFVYNRGAEIAGKRIGSVWGVNKDKAKDYLHPTQKPVELVELAITTFGCKIGLDPFLGSGTTLIACERLSRKCYGVEKEPKYIAVVLERWHEMTGQTPVLLGENGEKGEGVADGKV